MNLLIIPWRSPASLPQLQIPAIKVKVDTGARLSTLHAVDLDINGDTVCFTTYPFQKNIEDKIIVETKLTGYQTITNSGGQKTSRPCIKTVIALENIEPFEIEITLIDRSQMGFRMLLGREAIKGRFLVDPN